MTFASFALAFLAGLFAGVYVLPVLDRIGQRRLRQYHYRHWHYGADGE